MWVVHAEKKFAPRGHPRVGARSCTEAEVPHGAGGGGSDAMRHTPPTFAGPMSPHLRGIAGKLPQTICPNGREHLIGQRDIRRLVGGQNMQGVCCLAVPRGTGSVLNQLAVLCNMSAQSRTVIVRLRRGGGRWNHTRWSMLDKTNAAWMATSKQLATGACAPVTLQSACPSAAIG